MPGQPRAQASSTAGYRSGPPSFFFPSAFQDLLSFLFLVVLFFFLLFFFPLPFFFSFGSRPG